MMAQAFLLRACHAGSLRYFRTRSVSTVRNLVILPRVEHQGIFSLLVPLPGVPGLKEIKLPFHGTSISDVLTKLVEQDPSLKLANITDSNGIAFAKATKIVQLKPGEYMIKLNDLNLATELGEFDRNDAKFFDQSNTLIDLKNRLLDANETAISLENFYAVSQRVGANGKQGEQLLKQLDQMNCICRTMENDLVIDPKNKVSQLSSALDLQCDGLKGDLADKESVLMKIEHDITRTNQIHEKVHKEVISSLNARKWFVFASLNGVFGSLAYCVWDVLSWDVMEPITYFLGMSVVVASSCYHTITKRDATFGNIWENTYNKKMQSMLRTQKLNMEEVLRLEQMKIAVLEDIHLIRSRLKEYKYNSH